MEQERILFSRTPYPIIDRFPREFKRNWLKSIDLRYLLILMITSVIVTSAVSFLSSHQPNTTNSAMVNTLHKTYARFLREDLFYEPTDELLFMRKKQKDTYLYYKEQPEVTPLETQKSSFTSGTVNGKLSDYVNNSSVPTGGVTTTGSGNGRNKIAAEVSSLGVLQFLTTDSRLPDSDVLYVSDISNNEIGNVKFIRRKKKQAIKTVNYRRAVREQVTVQDVITAFSPHEEATSRTIEKNVEWAEIPPAAVPIRSTKKGKNGDLRKPEEVTRAIAVHNRSIQDCYKQALKKNPDLKGKLVVRLSVTPEGYVNDVKLINSTIDDDRMVKCILRKIKRWKNFGQCSPEIGNLYYRQTYVFGF